MYVCMYVYMYIPAVDVTYQGHLSDWVVLWSATRNRSLHTVTELDFDPSTTSHVYRLVVNGDDPKDVNVRS